MNVYVLDTHHNFNKNTAIVTKDEKIRKSGIIKTIW
jgi:hypothetical protein